MAGNGRLTVRQRRFIAALIAHRTIGEACEAAGIGERTGYRYLSNPAVRYALSEAQTQELGQITRKAVAAMTEALETLVGIAKDVAAPASARVSAARAILENALRFHEAVDLAERVAALEEKLQNTGGAK